MRILQINKFFYEKGGTERYFFSLSRVLEKRGHDVLHFSMRHPENLESPFASYFVARREYSHNSAGIDGVAAGLAFIRSREAARQVARLIDDHKPDVAHLHNIYHQITPSIIPALQRAGVPVIMTLHDHKLICPNYSMFDGRAYCYRCRGRRFHQAALARCHEGSLSRSLLLSVEATWQKWTRVYENVRFFIAPSRYLHDAFVAEGFSADRVIYIAPFVARDVPDGRATGEQAGETNSARRLPDRFILYFGRLAEEKGLFTLLDAVSALENVPLVVCGDGPIRHRLEERARLAAGARIDFTGYIGKAALNEIIRRASVAVLPSICPENAPYSVLEAMAFGVPVIVSNRGGLPELIESGGGSSFEAGNPDSLASRIREFWEDGRLAEDAGRKGREFVEGRLTEGRHLEEIENLYRRAAGTLHRGGWE
jgi:glycosyltransferase involved in cell wall biosynthesis